MNNKRFITEVASQTGYTNKSTQDLADSLIKIMAAQLEEGNSILVPNFGTFEVKKKNERPLGGGHFYLTRVFTI